MSETNIPEEALKAVSDVEAKEEQAAVEATPAAEEPKVEGPRVEEPVAAEPPAEEEAKAENLADKTLAELSEMFRSLKEAADSIENAVRRVLGNGLRTADLAHGGPYVSTAEMTDAIIKELR